MARRNALMGALPWVIIVTIQVAFAAGIILALLQGSWELALVSLVGLVLSFLPRLIEHNYRIDLPMTYELVIVLFVFAGIFMGELAQAYERFWWWDVVLHTSSGVLIGYVGFLLLALLYRRGKISMSPGLMAFFTFSVGMASAGVWEVIEFAIDQLFGTSMQKGLSDTMGDIIVAGLGSLAATTAAYIHVKWPRQSILRTLVQEFARANPQLDRKNKRGAKS